MTRSLVAIFGFALFIVVAEAGKPTFTVRLHALGNANDSEVFARAVTLPISRREVYVEKIPTVSERDVVAAQVYPAANGTFGAVFKLDDHGRLGLEALSVEHRGDVALVVVNGREVTELQIDRRVSDGLLYLPAGLTAQEAQALTNRWPRLGERKRR